MTVPSRLDALSDYLEGHLRTESKAIDSLAALVEGRPEDVASYLIGLILDDERRHHEIFGRIRNSLESTIQWRDIEPNVPTSLPTAADAARLLAATERLLEMEKADEVELVELRKRWEHDGAEHELWAVLVEVAELDTRKHIRLLSHLRDTLRDIDS
jgi:hypothetical protein